MAAVHPSVPNTYFNDTSVVSSGGAIPYRVIAASNSDPAIQSNADLVCDGTNDQVNINQFLLEVNSASNYGAVYMANGDYYTLAPIEVPSITLFGPVAHYGAYIHVENGFVGDAVIKSIGSLSKVSHLAIDGQLSFYTVNDVHGISEITHVSNCGIYSCYGDGIQIDDNTLIYIQDNIINSCKRDGIRLTNIGDRFDIKNNRIIGCGQTRSGVAGIYVSGTTSYEGCSRIHDNDIVRNWGHGIRLEGGAGGLEEVMIHDNYIASNGQTASNTYDGIHLAANILRANIQGNTVRRDVDGGTNKHRYGINVAAASCSNNLVTNNSLYLSGVTGSLNNAGTSTTTAGGNQL